MTTDTYVGVDVGRGLPVAVTWRVCPSCGLAQAAQRIPRDVGIAAMTWAALRRRLGRRLR